MISNKHVILCPEIVPLDNKGEEAIIKGIMDLLHLNFENCMYQVIDPSVNTLTIKNELYLHPSELFFSEWRTKEYGLGFSIEHISSSICAIIRHSLNLCFPKWINVRPRVVKRLVNYIQWYRKGSVNKIPEKYLKSIQLLANTDYIIAGHNGGLNEDVCHILLALKEIKINYTIFGSCMKPNINSKYPILLFNKAFMNSDNIIIRNPIGFRWYKRYFPYIAELCPDPAYYMAKIDNLQIASLVKRLGLVNFFKNKVIVFTTAEPAPISLRSFDAYSYRISKIKAHRRYLSEIVKFIILSTDYNILFLPHTIGPENDMDDRKIAKNVLSIAGIEDNINGRCYVLEEDLNCRELKGLISKSELLIAERVHSAIGAIGCHIPIICLSSSRDNRVNGMLKEMAGLSDYILPLDDPKLDTFIQLFGKVIKNNGNIIQLLEKIDFSNKESLERVSKTIHF